MTKAQLASKLGVDPKQYTKEELTQMYVKKFGNVEKSIIKTVHLRMSKDDGQWLFTLPGSGNRRVSTINSSTGDKTITICQRVQRNAEGEVMRDPSLVAEESTYNYHYVLLDDDYTGMTKAEVLADGIPESLQLDVMTGDYTTN